MFDTYYHNCISFTEGVKWAFFTLKCEVCSNEPKTSTATTRGQKARLALGATIFFVTHVLSSAFFVTMWPFLTRQLVVMLRLDCSFQQEIVNMIRIKDFNSNFYWYFLLRHKKFQCVKLYHFLCNIFHYRIH